MIQTTPALAGLSVPAKKSYLDSTDQLGPFIQFASTDDPSGRINCFSGPEGSVWCYSNQSVEILCTGTRIAALEPGSPFHKPVSSTGSAALFAGVSPLAGLRRIACGCYLQTSTLVHGWRRVTGQRRLRIMRINRSSTARDGQAQ